jgi:signal transduction histidine kinase
MGYFLGMLNYFSLGYNKLAIQDLFVIIIFIISYLLFLTKKISFQTAMKVIAILVVSDLLYPGIILFSHAPTSNFYDGNIAIYIILVFIIAVTTDKKFTILIIISTILLLTINSVLFNNQSFFKALPGMILFIGGTGTSGIIFDDLINKLLKQANESKNKIQELSDWKQDIIRNVIHDLKVPVSSILNLSSKRENSSENRIYSQALNINKQLEKILDIERLEEPNLELKKELISVHKLLEQAIIAIKTLALEKNISISPQFNTNGEILCDNDLMERLIVNVLSNAIKYSPSNCQIQIFVDRNDSNCQISVKDSGVGISEEHLQHVFEKFYSVTNEKSKNSFSTGLGLAFCKLVADVHKGSIHVKSKIGEGTIVEIIIPEFIADNISHDNTIIAPKVLSFTKEEKEFLCQICKQIKDIPIYRASEIIMVTKHLGKDTRKNIQNWYERFTDAVYSGNEKVFEELIQICIFNKK